MKAKDITINGATAVEMIASSFDLYKKDFKTREEHLMVCQTIRGLFGAEVYDNVLMPEILKEIAKNYPNP